MADGSESGVRAAILVVDDDEELRNLTAIRLRRAGFDVVTASTGEAALERAAERPLSLAVLDIRMPGMDGLELTRRLRAAPRNGDVPILVHTASVRESDATDVFAAGADRVLHKPCTTATLLEAAEAAIAHRKHT